MNLTELTDKVTNILIDAPASVTDEIHNELDAAQREAEDRYAFKVMKDIIGATLEEGEWQIDKPTDWLRPDVRIIPYWIVGTPNPFTIKQLIWAPDLAEMLDIYSYDILEEGEPKFLVEDQWSGQSVSTDVIAVYPRADDKGPSGGRYTIKVPYVRRLDPPSTASSDTWFMDTAWRYLVFKASSECLSLNRDHEESTLYALKAEREFKRLMNQDKRSRFTGDTLPIQRDAGAPFNQRLR